MNRGILCVTLLALALWGCGADDNSATMRPGEDCLSCHNSGNNAFTLAGTVFTDGTASSSGLSGVTLTVTDSKGATVTLTSNSVGNFFTSQSLTFPVNIALTSGSSSASMSAASRGGCNSCHGTGSGDSAGRVHVP